MVRRRHVFYFEGYDPQGLPGYFALFRREFSRFLKLWPIRASLSEPQLEPDVHGGCWRIDAAGPNWRTETTYEMLSWDDLVKADLARPLGMQMLRIGVAYLDFVATGTAARVLLAAWRFGLFLLYPAVMIGMTLVIATGAGVGAYEASLAATGRGIAVFAGLAAGVLYLAFAHRILKRWYAIQLGNMWLFVRDQIRGHRPDFDQRIIHFAECVVRKAKANDVDEIVLVGHSCGGLVGLLAAAEALARDPELGRHGPAIVLLSLGSIMPAAALHPAGRTVRAAIERIVNEPSIRWIKRQSRKDVINLYQFDPVNALDIPIHDRRFNPQIVPARFSDCLTPETYHRFRLNFFRMHFQFIMANDRRAPYDYFLSILGPAPVAAWAQAPAQQVAAFAPDAAFTPAVAADAGDPGPAQWRSELPGPAHLV